MFPETDYAISVMSGIRSDLDYRYFSDSTTRICICIMRYPVDGVKTKYENHLFYAQSLRYFIKYLVCNLPHEVKCVVFLSCLSFLFLEGIASCCLVGWLVGFCLAETDSGSWPQNCYVI